MQQINIDRLVICGRGEGALLAWKLGSGRRVIDVVVVPGSGVVGGSSGVYQRLRGEETINTQQARCKQMHDMIDAMLTVF